MSSTLLDEIGAELARLGHPATVNRVCPLDFPGHLPPVCSLCSEQDSDGGCRLTDDPPMESRIAVVRDEPDLDCPIPQWAPEQSGFGREWQ